jgi:hypothetical protein
VVSDPVGDGFKKTNMPELGPHVGLGFYSRRRLLLFGSVALASLRLTDLGNVRFSNDQAWHTIFFEPLINGRALLD